MAGDSGSPSLLWVCFRFRCFLGIDFGHSIVTLEQYITKKHKSLQSQTNTSYCCIGILDWEFVPPKSPSTWKDVCVYVLASNKIIYIYILYIICILFIYNSLKLYLQCQDLEWQTLMNILPSKTSATRLEEGCNTHILCNTHQSTNLGKPKFETILKHSHLRRFWFWKPRFGHCLQHVFNKKMPNKFQD